MPELKKKYTIEFLYTDNSQIYQDDVKLTDEEMVRVKEFLERLEKEGEIEQEGGGNPLIRIYVPFRRSFATFKTLKRSWTEGSLVEMGKNYGVEL